MTDATDWNAGLTHFCPIRSEGPQETTECHRSVAVNNSPKWAFTKEKDQ